VSDIGEGFCANWATDVAGSASPRIIDAAAKRLSTSTARVYLFQGGETGTRDQAERHAQRINHG
jgi:hypothetical protein